MRKETILCDQCEKEEPIDTMMNWFRLESQGNSVEYFGQPQPGRDFCSLACVAANTQYTNDLIRAKL